MEFGGAPRQLLDLREIGAMRLTRRGLLRDRRNARFLKKAIEISQRMRPAVSLIPYPRMQHAEGDVLALAVLELNRTQQCRSIGEAGVLGQESTHLDLGMHALCDLAVELDHE